MGIEIPKAAECLLEERVLGCCAANGVVRKALLGLQPLEGTQLWGALRIPAALVEAAPI